MSAVPRERLLALLLQAERSKARGESAIPRRQRPEQGLVPASFAQERLWFLDQLGLAGKAYNAPLVLRLAGDLVEEALERSFTEIVRRHEILRTRFGMRDGVPYQIIDEPRPFPLRRADLSTIANAEQRLAALHAIEREEWEWRFDLANGPLIRALLVRLSSQEHELVLTMHHIVEDGWSLGVLARELSAIYTACVRGLANLLPELPLQYADYAIWQRQWLEGEVRATQLEYWKKQLHGAAPQLALPTDRPRPAVESANGAELKFEISPALCSAARQLGRDEGATLFMVLLAAFQLLLARWSGQQDVSVGTPVAGRTRRELEPLIGFFVNTLVVRTLVGAELTFRQLLAQVKDSTIGAFAHQDVPFDALVRELRPDRSLTQQPIFQVLMALQNYPTEDLELPGLTGSWVDVQTGTAHFDITLFFSEADGGLVGTLEYATDLFDAATMQRLAESFGVLLESIANDPDELAHRLPLMSEAQRQIVRDWNATGGAFPRDRCIQDLFAEQAARTPTTIAVEHRDAQLTYAELDERAERLARVLRSRGVGPDVLVAIYMERGLEMVVGVLAVLKAGGAYLPMDPSYPAERLRYMMEDAAPRVAITQLSLESRLPATDAAVLVLDRDPVFDAPKSCASATPAKSSPEDLVYVIYTSGSTGRSKGTAMPHRAVVNLMQWHRDTLGAPTGVRVLQFAALGFDVAFQEIFSTLCHGGTLVLLDEWLRREPRALGELLIQRRIERLFLPPLMLQSLAEHFATTASPAPPSLRDIIVAGEQLRISPEIVRFFHSLPGSRLHNHYGPTETHVVTALTLEADPATWPALPAIGRPIANSQIHVLDAFGASVPIGVAGEIFIGGAGVARGYLGRPELTEQRFVPDPFDTQARLYRTGDLGRWRADGQIEYLGRNDHQVKVRGYRIELGEIEAQLARYEGVREAAVIAPEVRPGERRVLAYITARSGCVLTSASMREHLLAVLPDYMLPSAFIVLDQMPLTPSGKLDRLSLPLPAAETHEEREHVAPEGDLETALAEIWSELLGVKRIGRHDNFFELGGHSLHAMRLIARIEKRFAARMLVIAVFQHPTLQLLARHLGTLIKEPASHALPGESGTVQPGNTRQAPLTFSQQAHWNIYRLGERHAIRQIASATQLHGRLDIDALGRSLDVVVNRHEALRTRIVRVDGHPVQEIAADGHTRIDLVDLCDWPEDHREHEVRRLIDAAILGPVDVYSEPLFVAPLVRLSAEKHLLILALEHLISDAKSLSILMRELFAAYAAFTSGRALDLPPAGVPFGSFAAEQKQASSAWLARHSQFWRERLAGAVRLRYPSDVVEGQGYGIARVDIDLARKEELAAWCRVRGTTVVLAVFTAWVALVARWCRVSDLTIQYQSDGRFRSDAQESIGYFASPLYIRTHLNPADTFLDLLERVTREYCAAYEHADDARLAAELPRPLWLDNGGFNWVPDDAGGTAFEAGSLHCTPYEFEHPMTRRDSLDQEPWTILYDAEGVPTRCHIWYSRERFAHASMQRFSENLLVFIDALLRGPERPVANVVLR